MLGRCFFNGLPIVVASLDMTADAGVLVDLSPIPKLNPPVRLLPPPALVLDGAFGLVPATFPTPMLAPAGAADVPRIVAAASGSAE
jgi:hypothetical protein